MSPLMGVVKFAWGLSYVEIKAKLQGKTAFLASDLRAARVRVNSITRSRSKYREGALRLSFESNDGGDKMFGDNLQVRCPSLLSE